MLYTHTSCTLRWPTGRAGSVWMCLLSRKYKYDVTSTIWLGQSMCILEEQSCQSSFWSDLKRRSFRLFEQRPHHHQQQ